MSCISGSGYPCSSTCRRSSFDDLRRTNTHTNRSRVLRLLRWPHEPFLDEIHEFYLDSTHRRISTTLHLTHSKVFLKSLMDVFVDPSSSLCRLTLTSLDYLRLVLVTFHYCRWFSLIHFHAHEFLQYRCHHILYAGSGYTNQAAHNVQVLMAHSLFSITLT